MLTALKSRVLGSGEGGGTTTYRRILLLLLVAGIMTVGTVGVAMATSGFSGGGWWERGYTGPGETGNIYSYYNHHYSCHSSSVHNRLHYKGSGRTPKGIYATVSMPASYWYVDYANYRNYC